MKTTGLWGIQNSTWPVLAGVTGAVVLAALALAVAPNPLILVVVALVMAPAAVLGAMAALAMVAFRWAAQRRAMRGSRAPMARLAPAALPSHGSEATGVEHPTPLGVLSYASSEMPEIPALAPSHLAGTDIFRGLTQDHLQAIAALSHRMQLPADTPLTEGHQQGVSLYCILGGQVELYIPSHLGHTTIRIAGPGESLPLAALVGSGRLISSARTMTDCDIAIIPAGALRELCLVQPDMGLKVYAAIAAIIAERYRATLARLTDATRDALRQAEFWANV